MGIYAVRRVLFCLVISQSATTWGQHFVGVPSDVTQEARFVQAGAATPSSAGSIAQGTAGARYLAQGADGATAVLDGSSLITALTGTRLSVNSTVGQSSQLSIDQGGVHLDVGATETQIHLDGVLLVVQNARLAVIKTAAGYAVQLKDIDKGGQANLAMSSKSTPAFIGVAEPVVKKRSKKRGKAKPPAPNEALQDLVAGQPARTRQPSGRHFPLVKGQPLVVKNYAEPVVAAPAEAEALAQLSSRLTPPVKDGPLLVLQDVEHLSDLELKTISAQSAFENIEIEEIDVEAGCVEICLD